MPRHEDAAAELRRHEAADATERAHVSAVLDLLSRGDGVFTRSHFLPGHITASAFIVHPGSRTILLHHHRRLDRWLQMGGHVDGAETAAEAAMREAREESGLADLRLLSPAILDVDVHPIPAGKGEPDHHHFDLRYLVATAEPGAIARDDAESIDLRWFTLDEADRLMGSPESTRTLRKIARVLEETS